MSVRLFHKGARLVFVVRRRAAGQERWWSPGGSGHDWGRVLHHPLALLGLEPRPDGSSALMCRIGRVHWTRARHWATIELHLDGGSPKKRRLVATALLKAARYVRPAPVGR